MKESKKSKLTEAACAAIIRGVETGLTRTLCAKSAGIARETFYLWVNSGKKDISEGKNTKRAQLVLGIRKAEADKAEKLLNIIEQAAMSDVKHWTAAAWLLERRYKEEYSKREEINQHHSGSVGSTSAAEIDDRIKQLMGVEKNDNTI